MDGYVITQPYKNEPIFRHFSKNEFKKIFQIRTYDKVLKKCTSFCTYFGFDSINSFEKKKFQKFLFWKIEVFFINFKMYFNKIFRKKCQNKY